MITFSGLMSATIPNNILNKRNKKSLEHVNINFATLLNKISLKYTNKKILNSIQDCISNKYNITYCDILFICEFIMFHLFDKNGNIKTVVKFLKDYDISVSDLEEILKGEKFNNYNEKSTKKIFTLKLKKQLLEEYNA